MSTYYETELELGERALFCTVYVEFDYHPGEPRVLYYKDGSGYPGSSAYVDPYEIQVTTAEVGGETLTREELAKIGGDDGWLRLLDQLAGDVIQKDCEEWGPMCEEMAASATGEQY